MHAAEPPAELIHFVHVLRGVAPVLVVWAHLCGWWLIAAKRTWVGQTWFEQLVRAPLHLYQNGGHLGVVIFFLISGFIITHVSLREGPAEFLIKRFFRLFPPVIVAVILMYVAQRAAIQLELGTLVGNGATRFGEYVTSMLIVTWARQGGGQALSVLWSLFVEIMFYSMVWATILRHRDRPVATTVVMTVVAALIIMPFKAFPYFAYLAHFTIYLPLLIVGRVGYFYWTGVIPLGGLILLGGTNFLLMSLLYSQVWPGQLFLAGQEPFATYLLAFVIFFGAMQLKMRRVPRLIEWAAQISYQLYLVHLPVGMFTLSLLAKYNVSFGRALSVAIVASLAAASLLYVVLDVPMQNLGRRVAARFKRARGGAVFAPQPLAFGSADNKG